MYSGGVHNLSNKTYFLVEADILPDVFLRVIKAKELLASGEAKNVSRAATMAGVSRSAFYKYKDSIHRADALRDVTTLTVALLDEKGALQALLADISAAGGSVVTINQNAPENGAASVSVTLRTDSLGMTVRQLCDLLLQQRTVVDIKQTT